VYEEIRRPFAKALDDVIGIPRKSVLQFNEIFEQIRQKQFEIVDFVRENNGGREFSRSGFGGRCRENSLGFIMDSWSKRCRIGAAQ
jgi:hypothetical protein